MTENKVKKEIVLRPYQQECVDLLNKTNGGRHLVVLATGLGKTVIFSKLKRDGRTLILSHRDELVRQPIKYYDCPCGVEKADEHSHGEPVVSASVQTLRSDARLDAFKPDDFDTIIVDEAHHAAAESYKKILNYFKPRRVFGFTATPKRGDKVRLTDVFDDIIYEKDIRWGIKNHYLTDIKSKRVFANLHLKKVHKTMGDFNEGELSNAIKSSNAINKVVDAYMKYCFKQNKHVLLFTVSVDLCNKIADALRLVLPDGYKNSVAVVTGNTPQEERNAILKAYSDGNIRCIINCMVLTEGTDLPITDTVINARPTSNASLFQQMVGRGLRLHDGKKYCLVLDLCDDDLKGRKICTAPTLFGIDPDKLSPQLQSELEDKPLEEVAQEIEEIEEFDEQTAKNLELQTKAFDIFTGEYITRIENKTDLEDVPEELNRFAVSVGPLDTARYMVRFDGGEFRLSEPDVLNKTNIQLIKDDEVVAAGSLPMQDAANMIDEYIDCKTHNNKPYLWSSDARQTWDATPITYSQESKICQLINQGLLPNDVPIAKLSKAQASQMIDLGLRHGAMRKRARQKQSEVQRKDTSLAAKLQRIDDAKQTEKSLNNEFEKLCKELKAWSNTSADEGKTGIIQMVYTAPKKFQQYMSDGKRMASAKQLDFIDSLRGQLQSRNILIDGDFPDEMPMREATAIIDFLMTAREKNIIRNRHTCAVILVNDIMHQIKEHSDEGKAQYIIKVPYTMHVM